MAILIGALLAALLLNVAMVRGSYEQTDLRRDVGRAAQDIQSLQSELSAASASLPQRARDLGMVPAGPPRMIELSTGQVVGTTQDAGQ
jgi:hypothetical protein